MDCRTHFRIAYDQMYTGFTGESARSGFFKGHVDFSFSSISLSFQSKVAVFADFLYGEFCPSTLVMCPALSGVGWSIRVTKEAGSLLLTAWLRAVTSTAESLSRSDSRLCGLPSVSTSLTFVASDLVVPFQPRWSAPPRLFTPLSKTLSTFHFSVCLTSRAEQDAFC